MSPEYKNFNHQEKNNISNEDYSKKIERMANFYGKLGERFTKVGKFLLVSGPLILLAMNTDREFQKDKLAPKLEELNNLTDQIQDVYKITNQDNQESEKIFSKIDSTISDIKKDLDITQE